MYDDLTVQLTREQTALYLERIGLVEEAGLFREDDGLQAGELGLKPDLRLLDKLIYAHQITVPFENLSIILEGKGVELGTEYLFDKIVTRRRGGYCFELNKSFNSLLLGLGYKTTAHVGRIFSSPYLRPRVHRINLVYLDEGKGVEPYFSDVSSGGTQPAQAVPLKTGTFTDFLDKTFRFNYGEVHHDQGIRENTWVLYRINDDGDALGLVAFEEQEQYEVDFVPHNHFTSTHPESRFVSNVVVNQRRVDGHASITNDLFRLVAEGQEPLERDVSDPNVRAEVLESYFGIVL
ncbi:MAG: arylamine N-acetyltransferase [Coriobacteriia bacterium]|nr:arylamine N-acetyltransferase [Coriobacteriia bacterium]